MAGYEGNCKWHFAKSGTKYAQGPMDAKGLNFNKTPWESLVRESIQNSIDAAASDHKPVIVTFAFRKASSNDFPELFKIDKHIQGCLDKFRTPPCEKRYKPMLEYLEVAKENDLDYLEIADENTKGMPYRKGDEKCPFFGFVMSAGNPVHDTEDTGGAFGIGKAAYFNVSKISTLLVSTMTGENQLFFEGVASLSTNLVDGKEYQAVGFYSDNNEEEPIMVDNLIPTRFRRKSIGTSMYIMGLGLDDKSLNEAERQIREAVVKHFWLAILQGKLQVNIRISKDDIRSINSGNLEGIAEDLFHTFQDKKRGHGNSRPYIDAVIKAGQDDKHFVFEEKLPLLGNAKLYLLKDKDGTDNILFMRKSLMLIKYAKNSTNYGFYAVFVCDDPEGNQILRNMENPAHNEWEASNCVNAADKANAETAIQEIREFLNRSIKTVFADDTKGYLTFGGLDEFLAIPSSMDEIDSEYQGNHGKPTGDIIEDNTGSSTTNLEGGNIRVKEEPTQGKVTIKVQTAARVKTPEDNNDNAIFKGNTDTPRKNQGGGEAGTINPSQPFVEDDNEENERTYAEPLSVHYRSYAQMTNGQYDHYIVIHSNKDAEAQVTVFSGGENSEDEVDIEASDKGVPIGNSIKDVSLVEGKNILKIRFADGMRHAIKLNINENR